MRKRISTKMHGILDYTTAAGLFALPRLLRWDPTVTRLLTGSAIATTLYSLFTKYELGLFKKLPMKAHLGLDKAQSAIIAASPLAFSSTRSNRGTMLGLIGLALFEALVTMNSQTRPKRKFLGFEF